MTGTRYFLDASWPRFFQAMGLGLCVFFLGIYYKYIQHYKYMEYESPYIDQNFGFIIFAAFLFSIPSIISLSALRFYRYKLSNDILYLLLSFLALLLLKFLFDQLMLAGSNGSFQVEEHLLTKNGKRTWAGYVYKLKDAILHFSSIILISFSYLYLRHKRDLKKQTS